MGPAEIAKTLRVKESVASKGIGDTASNRRSIETNGEKKSRASVWVRIRIQYADVKKVFGLFMGGDVVVLHGARSLMDKR